MNKIPLIISIVALLGVIILFVGRSNTPTNKAKVSSNKEISTNIAYVNLDTLIESYNFYVDKKIELVAIGEKKSGEIESRYKSLQLKAYNLQKGMQERMFTQATAQKKQQAIALEEQKLMQDKQNYEMELAEKNQNMMLQILDSVKNYIKIYNKDFKYSVVFANDTLGQSILFAEQGMNISKDILDALNERYQSTKKDIAIKSDKK